MAISVVTNVASLNAQRNLMRTQKSLNSSMQRLSSGLRINSGADDAAGLAISEKLKSQIRSMGQSQRNANDAVSLLQTSEGAMNEISAMLLRMRELAVQSSTDTVGSVERQFLHDELGQLRNEVDRIAEVTEFNGIKLLDGSATGLDFQVGINATTNDRITANIADMHATSLGGATTLDSVSLTTMAGAQSALAVLDEAITDVSSSRANVGALQNRLQTTIANLATARENLSAANSRVRDIDVASESAQMTKSNILMQAGVSVLAQANQAPSVALSLLG